MDITLNYREAGSGFPLILLHGNGEDSAHFEHQIEYFSKEYHVIAIDTRGHGESPRGTAPFTFQQFADDLKAFMDEHGLFRAHILGFSDGADTALLFALQNNERVDRLVLNGANLYPDGMEPELRERIEAKLAQAAQAKDDGDEAKARYERLNLMATEPAIDPKSLATMDRPALVIVGTNDVIEADHTQLIYRSLPNAELAIIPGNHFIAYNNPVEFNKRVDAFLHEKL